MGPQPLPFRYEALVDDLDGCVVTVGEYDRIDDAWKIAQMKACDSRYPNPRVLDRLTNEIVKET